MTGEDYYDSKEFRKILSKYEKARNAGEPVFQDADELAEIADYYRMNGESEQADIAIKLALKLSPGAVSPLCYCIHEALDNNDTAKAWHYLNQIIDKDDPDYVYCRGEILVAEDRIDEAEQYFNDTLKTVPDDERQDYLLDVVNIYDDGGLNEKAMEWMMRVTPDGSSDYKEAMARSLFGVGKFKDSARLFNELLDTDPFQKRYWNALASAQYMTEDYSGAVESSEYAIAIDPNDPDGLIAKANSLYHLGNRELAIDYYHRYLDQVPDDEFTMLLLGTCLVDCDRSDEAVDVLKEAVEIGQPYSPYLPDIYQELAFAYKERGEIDEAIRCIDMTDAMDCDHIQMTVIKGHIQLSAEHIKEAEHYFRQALQESDTPAKTLLRIIVSLYDNLYLEAAYKMMLHYFKLVEPDDRDGYAYMALCCHDLKRNDEYMQYLEKACQLNPAECKFVLSHLFPKEVEPKNYYNYLKENS
jgi:tetratricopeptide (TPR) repeat protein